MIPVRLSPGPGGPTLDALRLHADAPVRMRLYLAPWRIDIELRSGVPRLLPAAAIGRQVARTLEAARPPTPAVVGVILGDDAELARLNARHLGQDEATDVLSFPLLPPSAFPSHEGQDQATRAAAGGPPFALPPGRRVHLGEIVVSVERAIDQAETGRGGQTSDVRWSPADELRLLVTHGVLHLCGWDHAVPVEEGAMRALEREVLDRG